MTTTPRLLLVTGGSRGIGAATCRAAIKAGYNLAINYHQDKTGAEAIAAEAKAAGLKAACYQADVANDEAVGAMFAAIRRDLGRITHFLCNAGIASRASRLDEAEPEMMRHCVDVNVNGSLFTLRHAIRAMAKQHGGQGGAIVTISSVAAQLGGPNEFVWYAAAKAAIESMTIGLSKEIAADGIRINGVSPGLIETGIHNQTGIADRARKLSVNVPMQRTGRAEEVAETVMFLLSDAASYITGAIVKVTGGR